MSSDINEIAALKAKIASLNARISDLELDREIIREVAQCWSIVHEFNIMPANKQARIIAMKREGVEGLGLEHLDLENIFLENDDQAVCEEILKEDGYEILFLDIDDDTRSKLYGLPEWKVALLNNYWKSHNVSNRIGK
jgi:hypothetical protein